MKNQWFKQFSIATMGFMGLMLVMVAGQLERQKELLLRSPIDTQVIHKNEVIKVTQIRH
jgi:hypothetical protein